MNAVLKSLQLLIGITIGLIGLGGVLGGAGWYIYVTQMNIHPPKPVFAEERSGSKPVATKPKPKLPVTTPTQPAVTTDPDNPDAVKKLAPEAYDARVIWKDGLSLKKEPDSGAEKIGGVAFNAKVAIVKTSDDKQWVFIQSETDNLQGWVKAGNIDKSAATLNQAQDPPTPSKPKTRIRNRRNRQADPETN